VDHAATDDEITVYCETTVDVATTKTREAVVGSALLLAAGVIATALVDDNPISPIGVFVLAAAVGGEQLWHRRRDIPSHVPVTLVDRNDVDTSVMSAGNALFILAVLGAFLLLSELLPGGGAALVGPLAGYVLRDLVMAIRVARWQKRHDHVLAWVGSGDGVQSRILV